jgi:carboxypeptidase T
MIISTSRYRWTGSLLLVLIGLFCLSRSAQATDTKYTQVRIFISSKEDIHSLQQAGLDFDHIRFNEESFDVVLNEHEIERLKSTGRPYEVLIDDLLADYLERTALSAAKRAALAQKTTEEFPVQGMELGSMGGYYTFDEVVAQLDAMRRLYPHLISIKQSIGPSVEGRSIWIVKISDQPDVDEEEPEILYTSLHHAREPEGMMALMYFMYYLLEHYEVSPEAKFLIENRELYFVPVVNPDGYVYNQQTDPNGGGLWRKNRRDNGNGTFGVDLNRNYEFQWGGVAGSTIPSNATYRGTHAFSEPETQAMRDFCNRRDFELALNYHTPFGTLSYPWYYTTELTPDAISYMNLAEKMTQVNQYPFGALWQLGYGTFSGVHDDWMYGERTTKSKIMVFGDAQVKGDQNARAKGDHFGLKNSVRVGRLSTGRPRGAESPPGASTGGRGGSPSTH